MKSIAQCGMFVLLTVLSLPTTSDAFSRRSHSSEVTQGQAVTVPLKTDGGDGSPNAVPEPPVLLLMTIALGAFALCSALRRFRRVL